MDSTVGKKIKKLRKDLGITQSMLAEKLEVTPVMISQYENGKRLPKLHTINKIAAALGVTPAYLMGIETEESPIYGKEYSKYTQLGENMEQLRRRVGMTRRQVAKYMEIFPETLQDIEKGKLPPTDEQLKQFIKITNCTLAELNQPGWMHGVFGCIEHMEEIPEEMDANSERELLTDYRKLNTNGKEKVKEYASDLTKVEMYTEE